MWKSTISNMFCLELIYTLLFVYISSLYKEQIETNGGQQSRSFWRNFRNLHGRLHVTPKFLVQDINFSRELQYLCLLEGRMTFAIFLLSPPGLSSDEERTNMAVGPRQRKFRAIKAYQLRSRPLISNGNLLQANWIVTFSPTSKRVTKFHFLLH